jgi:hypothetical protein
MADGVMPVVGILTLGPGATVLTEWTPCPRGASLDRSMFHGETLDDIPPVVRPEWHDGDNRNVVAGNPLQREPGTWVISSAFGPDCAHARLHIENPLDYPVSVVLWAQALPART